MPVEKSAKAKSSSMKTKSKMAPLVATAKPTVCTEKELSDARVLEKKRKTGPKKGGDRLGVLGQKKSETLNMQSTRKREKWGRGGGISERENLTGSSRKGVDNPLSTVQSKKISK